MPCFLNYRNMENKEIRKIKIINLAVFLFFVLLAAAAFIHVQSKTFSEEKWREAPGERVNIVDSLLSKHDLIGMTEKEVTALLGENDNDSGYFSKDGRYVYYLGPERGLFSIDSEWLLIDFSDGKVSDFSLTTD